jgi:CRISPR/Cas system endoribonuclease Cas6 (RAMP superfamily)
MTVKDQLQKLAKEFPLVLYTDASRHFSTVQRMKAEKEMGIPIFLRTGCPISTKTGKAANTMTEDEWEEFYNALSERLKRDYPDLYGLIFSTNENDKGKRAD